jgi:putative tryptophan/tyrosine transport system substrate-binding protein
MRRREFLALIGMAAWSTSARAQQPELPVVGFLNSVSMAQGRPLATSFLEGLKESGFVEGESVTVEYRWADGQYNRLPALAADLVNRRVAVLVATGGGPAGLAAKAATDTIPIVFIGTDPVKLGLVSSYSRPGGNVTGVDLFSTTVGPKRLEMLRELVPRARVIGLLVNSDNPNAKSQTDETRIAAEALGLKLEALTANRASGFDALFSSLKPRGIDALLVGADPFFNSQREVIVALAARYRVPTVYQWREFAEAGGLMSYGTSITDVYRRAGIYAGRILKGADPADLPVVQPTKFELVVNLKTAKALGLEVPALLLSQTDEVIE